MPLPRRFPTGPLIDHGTLFALPGKSGLTAARPMVIEDLHSDYPKSNRRVVRRLQRHHRLMDETAA